MRSRGVARVVTIVRRVRRWLARHGGRDGDRRERRHGQVRAGRRRHVLSRDGRGGAAGGSRHRSLGAERPGRAPRPPAARLTVAAARSAGLDVVFATYPYPPREVADGLAQPDAFGAWLAELARQYPDVREFVVGNEPNQPAFWRPQFSHATQASAASFGPFLAAGYDSLKAVDPTLTVVGVGLSPRGNDRPFARSNVSTSPVRFLGALGAWYRRERPDPAADGRLELPPVPESRDRSARRGAMRGRTQGSSTSTASSRRSGTRSRVPRSPRRSRGFGSTSTRSGGRWTRRVRRGTRATRTCP